VSNATVILNYWFAEEYLMKPIKRIFTQAEKDLVYDLWKQGDGFIFQTDRRLVNG